MSDKATLNDLLLVMFDFNNEAYSVSSDIDQVSLSFQGNNVGTVMLNTEWSLSHKPQQPVITIVGDPTAVSSESITKAMTLVDLVNDFRNATDSTEHSSLTLNLVSSEINTSAEVLHESTQGEFDEVVEWTKERLATYGAVKRDYLVYHKPTAQTYQVEGYSGLVDLGIFEKDLTLDAIPMRKCTIGDYIITQL